jgi:hypothetical protein
MGDTNVAGDSDLVTAASAVAALALLVTNLVAVLLLLPSLAGQRGRSPTMWLLLGMLITPLIAIVLLLAITPAPEPTVGDAMARSATRWGPYARPVFALGLGLLVGTWTAATVLTLAGILHPDPFYLLLLTWFAAGVLIGVAVLRRWGETAAARVLLVVAGTPVALWLTLPIALLAGRWPRAYQRADERRRGN